MLALLVVPGALATNYYFSSSASCPGSGTSGAPYCALTSANTIDFAPGDQILLNRGSLWSGQQIQLQNSDDGSAVAWIVMDAYGSGARPILDWGKLAGQILIDADDIDYFKIQNLELREAERAMYFQVSSFGHVGLWLENLYIHDMLWSGGVGAAFLVSAWGSPPGAGQWYLKDITVLHNELTNSGNFGFSVNITPDDPADSFQNVELKNNYVHVTEGDTSLQGITTLRVFDNQYTDVADTFQS